MNWLRDVAVLTMTGRLFHSFGAAVRRAQAAVSVFILAVVSSILFVDRIVIELGGVH